MSLTSMQKFTASQAAVREELLKTKDWLGHTGKDLRLLQIDALIPFKDHPYKVIVNKEMADLAASILTNGVLDPILVRPHPEFEGKFEIVSGHRRVKASQILQNKVIPAYVQNLTDDEATIYMVESNKYREQLLPSEKAWAYRMELEARRRQGQRNDLTSSQVGTKSRTDETIASELGESRNQVHRYIRLTYLLPELLEMVDEGKIKFVPAVNLSKLSKENQQVLLNTMKELDIKRLGQKQVTQLLEAADKAPLTQASCMEALVPEKKTEEQSPAPSKGCNKITIDLPEGITVTKEQQAAITRLVAEYIAEHIG